jgi:hypothetical protein
VSEAQALTFMEMDLDLYRVTRFEDVQNAKPVRNWALQAGVTNVAAQGVLQASFPAGRGISVSRTAVGLPSMLRWFYPPPGSPTIRDVSAVALLRYTTAAPVGSIAGGIVLRGLQGPSPTLTGYACDANGTHVRLWEFSSGVGDLLAEVEFAVAQNEDVWMRFDTANISGGVTLRAKVWRGAISDEPAEFLVSFDDTTAFEGSGWVGLVVPGSPGPTVEARCGYFRFRSLFGSTVETHRHTMAANYVPIRDIPATPDLVSVALNPGGISLGSDLGKRSQLTVTMQDHPGSDFGEGVGIGSHWAKFRARGLFRRGQALSLVHGTLGLSLAEMERRHCVLESFSGPSRDRSFTIVAQDPLKLADNDRAQAPRISNGVLGSNIDAAAVSVTLAPEGIGDAEYPPAGFGNIGGQEIVAFERVGDVLTLDRGRFGTTPTDHTAGDRFQLCLNIPASTVATIINQLLIDYAGVDANYIPLADWNLECATYLPQLYSRLIPDPTGVNKLISELIEQAGLMMWPDDIAQLIRLQVLRPIPTTAFEYNDSNTLAGTIQPQEQPSTRITQIWTYYGVRNPLHGPTVPHGRRFRQ